MSTEKSDPVEIRASGSRRKVSPPLPLKLAPTTFVLLRTFVTLHFEPAYIFPPWCVIKKIGRKKKKKTGGSAEERAGRGGGGVDGWRELLWPGSLYLGLILTPPPAQTELSFLPLTQTT